MIDSASGFHVLVTEGEFELGRWLPDLPEGLECHSGLFCCLLTGFNFSVISFFLGDGEIDDRTSLRDLRVTLGLLLSKVDSSFQPSQNLVTTIRGTGTFDSELS